MEFNRRGVTAPSSGMVLTVAASVLAAFAMACSGGGESTPESREIIPVATETPVPASSDREATPVELATSAATLIASPIPTAPNLNRSPYPMIPRDQLQQADIISPFKCSVEHHTTDGMWYAFELTGFNVPLGSEIIAPSDLSYSGGELLTDEYLSGGAYAVYSLPNGNELIAFAPPGGLSLETSYSRGDSMGTVTATFDSAPGDLAGVGLLIATNTLDGEYLRINDFVVGCIE